MRFTVKLLGAYILLLGTFSSAAFAQKTCTPIDLRRDNVTGPAKSQGSTSYCYAYSSAYLLSHHYNANISALALGVRDFAGDRPEDQSLLGNVKITNCDETKEVPMLWGNGGLVEEVLEESDLSSLCLESEFPSDQGDKRVADFSKWLLEQKQLKRIEKDLFIQIDPKDVSKYQWGWLNNLNALVHLNAEMRVINDAIERNIHITCQFFAGISNSYESQKCALIARRNIIKFLADNANEKIYLHFTGYENSPFLTLGGGKLNAPGFVTAKQFSNWFTHSDLGSTKNIMTPDVLLSRTEFKTYPERSKDVLNSFAKRCGGKTFKRDYVVQVSEANPFFEQNEAGQADRLLESGKPIGYSYTFKSKCSGKMLSHAMVIVGRDKDCNFIVRDSSALRDRVIDRKQVGPNFLRFVWLE